MCKHREHKGFLWFPAPSHGNIWLQLLYSWQRWASGSQNFSFPYRVMLWSKKVEPHTSHHITSPLAKITAVSSSGLARDMQLTVCALGRHIFHTVAYIYICFHTNNKKDHFPQKRTNELQRAKLSKQEQKWAQICKIEQTQRQIKNKQKRIQKEQKWARKRYLKARMSPEEGKRTEIWTKKTEKLTKKSKKE